jgi:hypothetical protein
VIFAGPSPSRATWIAARALLFLAFAFIARAAFGMPASDPTQTTPEVHSDAR